MRIKRPILMFTAILLLLALFVPFLNPSQAADGDDQLVYVVPVEQSIEQGLEKFLIRAFGEAEEANADMIILEINTLGGEIDAALGIADLMKKTDIPVVAFIKGEAISAGSYISLNADKIYMEPESFIGAAAARTISGEEVDPKTTSWWAEHMRSAAATHGRDGEIARGMVDPNVEIPGITKKGELITLDSVKAVEYGMADGIIENREELLQELGMENATIQEVELSPAERLARFVTNPYVIPFLLIIGLAGILIELFVPGFGFPGIIGISSFGLYFFGHYFAGFAGLEAIALFLLGFLFIIIELFVPSFGIFGIIGIIGFALGIGMAAYQTSYGLISFTIALIVNIILAIFLFKYFGHRGIWNRFILKDEQKKEAGYVSHGNDKSIVGKQGITITKLRPSGTALIEGKRYDVVSEGNLIDANQTIEVKMIEGTRIVVQQVTNNN